VGVGSKQAVIQICSEAPKQLAFANCPFGGPTEEVMPEIAEGFAKVLRPISECFYDIERLRERKDTRHAQQELLPNSMSGS
jgi:hypothetical protein